MGLIGAEEHAQQYDSVIGCPYTPAGVITKIQYYAGIQLSNTDRE